MPPLALPPRSESASVATSKAATEGYEQRFTGVYPQTRVEIFDPAAGFWEETGPFQSPRPGQTTTLLADGRVLVTGGSRKADKSTAEAEVWNPSTGKWARVESMSSVRSGHTATLLEDGRVLVAGGESAYEYPRSIYVPFCEIWDPRSGHWTKSRHLVCPRSGHSAVRLLDGRVLLAGGMRSKSAEIWSPGSDSSWKTDGPWSHGSIRTAIGAQTTRKNYQESTARRIPTSSFKHAMDAGSGSSKSKGQDSSSMGQSTETLACLHPPRKRKSIEVDKKHDYLPTASSRRHQRRHK